MGIDRDAERGQLGQKLMEALLMIQGNYMYESGDH